MDLDNDLVEAPAKDLNSKTLPFAGPLARRFERFINPSASLSDSFRWRVASREAGAMPSQHPQQQHPPFHSPTSVASHASSLVSPFSHVVTAGPWAPLCRPDTRGALLVLRDFIQDLLMGVEDSCVFIRTETEVTILFDETLFGHISGPSELLVTTPHDAETDLLPYSPHLPPPPPASSANNEPQESFVLRFCRTQAFSTALVKILGGE